MAILILLLILLTCSIAISGQSPAVDLQKLMITAADGPESIAFDGFGGGPYTGVSDGRIIKWQGPVDGWMDFAFPSQWSKGTCNSSKIPIEGLCGRPLGLQFNSRTGELYIADAYFGLMVAPPSGGPERLLAAAAGNVPFKFTNGLDVDQVTGAVYFTDSSTRFQRWEYLLIVATGDSTGRLLKYDPATRRVSVLLSGLTYPNGVALSRDRSFLVVAGTTKCVVSRYWLVGPNAGKFETFAEVPGYPDNIKRNDDGEFWVAMSGKKMDLNRDATIAPAAVKLSNEGKVVTEVDGTMIGPLSEVKERNGRMWLGSVMLPYVGVL